MIRFFRHYIPGSMLLLTGIEFILFFLIAYFATQQYGGAHGDLFDTPDAYKHWLFAAILSLFHSMFGLYAWELDHWSQESHAARHR